MKEVEGTIVDYVERVRGGFPRRVRLFPIYEYYYKGEIRRYTCRHWKENIRRIGQKNPLYIDTRDNTVFEKSEIGLEIYLGVTFGGKGILMIVLYLMSHSG